MRKITLTSILVLSLITGAIVTIWSVNSLPGEGSNGQKTAQKKNLSYTTIILSGTRIDVEIADTPSARGQGLSGRSELKDGKAMLFMFDAPDYHGFWMKNMSFPIDIIWFNENRKIVDTVGFAKPEGEHPKKIYRPREKALYVLEVKAGFVKEKKIVLGDIFSFEQTHEDAKKVARAYQ